MPYISLSFDFIADKLFLLVVAITEKLFGISVTLSPCDIQTSKVLFKPFRIGTSFLISNFAFPYSLEVDS